MSATGGTPQLRRARKNVKYSYTSSPAEEYHECQHHQSMPTQSISVFPTNNLHEAVLYKIIIHIILFCRYLAPLDDVVLTSAKTTLFGTPHSLSWASQRKTPINNKGFARTAKLNQIAIVAVKSDFAFDCVFFFLYELVCQKLWQNGAKNCSTGRTPQLSTGSNPGPGS